MSKLRYSLDDLITQLREQGIKSIEEVSYAVLENDGKLSVFQNTVDYPMPIIIDGVINVEVLKDMKKNTNWVMKILKDYSTEDLKNYYWYVGVVSTNGETLGILIDANSGDIIAKKV